MKSLLYIALLFLGSCASAEKHLELEWVTVPRGTFYFGSQSGNDEEFPAVKCRVETFQLSSTEISNAQFEEFVKATGYVTTAEKSGGMVFRDGWKVNKKANWRMPEGRAVNLESWRKLPVVQVSYTDALAYCAWAGCRLPTELEWEYAAKLGASSIGRLNITSAHSPHPTTENVRSFGKNELGVYHQSGNVWEWCLDSYNSEIHDKLEANLTKLTPRGFQGRSFDPLKEKSTDTLRVIKGGSFLCQAGHCAGYRPAARQSAGQSEAYFHVGFRVVKR